VPLQVLGPLLSTRPSVGSRNAPPMPSPLTLPQLCMLFQSTHVECHGAEASAEQGERIAKSPLQRTLTAQITGQWAKHNVALEHIGVTRSVEMLELQRAQRFPACPTNPDTFVFAVLFSAYQPAPSQPNALSEKESRCTLNRTSSLFGRTFQRKGFGLASRQTFGRRFSAGASGHPFPRCLPTLKAARSVPSRCVLILWVIMSSLASCTQVLFAVTIISRTFWQFGACVQHWS